MTCSPFMAKAGFDANLSLAFPFYFAARENLVGDVPDAVLALITPAIAFWIVCLAYTLLDYSGWKWLSSYRIHKPDEIKSRNLVSRSEVIFTIVSQQAMQIVIGSIFVDDAPKIPLSLNVRELEAMESALLGFAQQEFVPNPVTCMLAFYKGEIAYWLYWWIIPVSRLIFAALIFDTWMYFVHRAMHMNKFLYEHIHSVHHRLYVPYACGSAYNHTVEAFLDMTGAFVAISVVGLTTREKLVFFTCGTLKGVHQHSGYQFPYDPVRWFSENDAEYHDIHHQAIGMKFNFSQVFFNHWDVIMGTRRTRKDIEVQRQKIQ